MTGTLLKAGSAACASIEVDAISIAGAKLYDRVFGARPVAAVALEAIAARKASLSFELHFLVSQSAYNFTESILALCEVDLWLGLLGNAGEVPKAKLVVGCDFVTTRS